MENINSMKIFIIILNYNGWIDSIACLESIFRNNYHNFEVIFIDNCSTDSSMEQILLWADGNNDLSSNNESPIENLYSPPIKKPISYSLIDGKEFKQNSFPEHDSKLTIIQTNENLGFAGGVNFGLKYAIDKKADYVWLINNDIIISSDSVSELLRLSLKNNNKKIIGSVIYYANKPDQIQAWGGGVINYFLGTTKHLKLPGKIDYLTGASLFIPIEILKSTGFFDEGFFLYWEDADYCMRAKKKGWGLDVAEKSIVYHKHNTSTNAAISNNKDFGDIQTSRGIIRFFFKNYGILGLIPISSRIIRGLIKRIKNNDYNQIPILIKTMWTSIKKLKK